MREKYLIRFDEEAVAVRYDFVTGYLTLGGVQRIRADIEMFMEVYFGVEEVEDRVPKFLPGKKISFTVKIGKGQFLRGVKKLEESLLIQKVESLGRVMR